MIARCRALSAAAAEHLAAPAKNQVDAAERAELENALQAFETLAPAPRDRIVRSAAVTKELTGLFRATDRLLKTQLDKLMAGFKATQPAFHHEYQAARVIVDAGGGTEAADDPPAPPGTLNSSGPGRRGCTSGATMKPCRIRSPNDAVTRGPKRPACTCAGVPRTGYGA